MTCLLDDLFVANQFLTRHGYITDHHHGASCGNSHSGGRVESVDHRVVTQYVCIWGSRVNELEFLPGLK